MADSAVWLRCGICGHVFPRKSVRHFKCTTCGAHFTKECDPPGEKGCGCFSCSRKKEVGR